MPVVFVNGIAQSLQAPQTNPIHAVVANFPIHGFTPEIFLEQIQRQDPTLSVLIRNREATPAMPSG